MKKGLFTFSLVLLLLFAPCANAQEAGTLRLNIKVTEFPEVGLQFNVSERVSARALVGIITDFGGFGGIGNLTALYRISDNDALAHYFGAGVTILNFDEPVFLGGLYGMRYRLSDRFAAFGEVGLDIPVTDDVSFVTTLLNTGVGVSYIF